MVAFTVGFIIITVLQMRKQNRKGDLFKDI